MSASLQRIDVASVDAIEQALKDDGGVIVEGLLEPEVVARIEDEVAAARAAANPGMKHLNPGVQFFYGDKTRHVNGVAAHSRTFATDVMIHPLYLALCDRILLPSCARYQLNLGHLIDRGPGSQNQWLHRDEVVWSHLPQPHAEIQLASLIALHDFRVENGATRIVPGSHRWPRTRAPEEHEIAHAVMPAGSAAIYLGSTIHGAGANSTQNEWRPGLHVSYTLGWLRTEENNYLAVPPEIARELPRRAQEILGYAVHDAIATGGGYLGMVGLQDPVELMAKGEL